MDDAIFRILPPSSADLLSTTIRIEKNHMEQLGIKTGEIVKVTGARTTAATCLPLEDGFSAPSDPEITYLENAPVLPQARPSGITMENLNHLGGEGLGQVRIEKTSSSVAERVSLVRVGHAQSGNEEFDESRLFGLIVSKDDRIYFRDEDYHLNFGCTVKDVKPEGFCIIDKDTVLEFSDAVTRQKIPHVSRGDLYNLKKVIPISHQIKTSTFALTIPSLEIYEEGLRCYLYIKGAYGTDNLKFMHSHVTSDVTVNDDLGNNYNITVNGGNGSSGPDGFDYKWEIRIPPINENAKEIALTIKEVRWQATIQSPPTVKPPTKDMRRNPSIQTRKVSRRPRYSEIEKFPPSMICSGPWEIKIHL